MMKLEHISQVIDSKFQLSGCKELIEKEGNKIITKVALSTSGQCLVYKFEDNGQIPIRFLSANKRVRKISDYVVFTMKVKTLYVLIFELKAGKGCPKEQLRATEILSEYIVRTAERVSNTKFPYIIYRKVGVTNKSLKKRTKPGLCSYDANSFVQLTSKFPIRISNLCV